MLSSMLVKKMFTDRTQLWYDMQTTDGIIYNRRLKN